jgi:hypothetical protein
VSFQTVLTLGNASRPMRHHMAQDLAKKRLRVQWQSRAIQVKPRAQDLSY